MQTLSYYASRPYHNKAAFSNSKKIEDVCPFSQICFSLNSRLSKMCNNTLFDPLILKKCIVKADGML